MDDPQATIPWNKWIAMAWSLLCLYVAFSVASRITADGLLSLHPVFGTRVYMQWLFQIIGIRRMNLGMVLGSMLVGLVYFYMDRMVRSFLLGTETADPEIDPSRAQAMNWLLGFGLIVLDALFFYRGLSRPSGWDTPQDEFAAFVFTALYLFLMAGAAYFNTILWLRSERTSL